MSQIHDFREVFLQHDVEGQDLLSFKAVTNLLQNIVDLGSRSASFFPDIWQKAIENKPTGSPEAWTIDFPDFILLWQHLLDHDFCSIKARSAQVAERAEITKQKSRILKTKTALSPARNAVECGSQNSEDREVDASENTEPKSANASTSPAARLRKAFKGVLR